MEGLERGGLPKFTPVRVCVWLRQAAAAARHQDNSTTTSTLLEQVAATTAAANCRRSSFSGQLRLSAMSPSRAAACRQATFRPVVVAAALRPAGLHKSACEDERPISTSDDESYGGGRLATRKRRHDDDSSSDDALTASDDDEEIRTIFCLGDDELSAMTSRVPAGSQAFDWSVLAARRPAAADCSVVHRPSLNLYKMQVSSGLTHTRRTERELKRMMDLSYVGPELTFILDCCELFCSRH